MNLLSVENLSKAYSEKVLFSSINFGVEQGQRIALIAANGSGKTTLLKILSGKEVFGLTPRVTFGELININNTTDHEHMLQTINESAHRVLKTHMAPTLSRVASDSLRQV